MRIVFRTAAALRRCNLIGLLVVAVGATGPAPAARADLITTVLPDSSYLASTTKIAIPGNEGDSLGSVSDGKLTVSFLDLTSSPTQMTVYNVGSVWSTWSSPPYAEDPYPTVLYTPLASVVLHLSQGVATFGFELEPDAFGPQDFTASYYSNGVYIGSITQSVDGNAGARLLAGTVTFPDPAITDVVISGGGSDFAIADLRYTLPSVPEPGSATLAIGAVVVLACVLARRRRLPRTP